jgi:DNA polymerase
MSVKVWRDTYKDAVKFWYKLQDAAFQTMRTKEETVCGHVSYDAKGAFLRANLPSGRSLHYMKPRIESVLAPWGKYKNSLTYDGLNDKNQWVRTFTHPGKLTENVDQAIARDLLADGMMKAAKNGIPIVMHVHDQVLGLVREEEAEERLQVLIECMTDLPPWAKGMPVGAAGHISKWFVKD